MANNGSTFTKTTYDANRRRPDPPSPAKEQANHEQTVRESAATRKFNKLSPEDKLRRLGLPKTT